MRLDETNTAGHGQPACVVVRQSACRDGVESELASVRSPTRPARTDGDELRAGDWRVLYEIDESEHTVTVFDIRYRSTAYRSRSRGSDPAHHLV